MTAPDAAVDQSARHRAPPIAVADQLPVLRVDEAARIHRAHLGAGRGQARARARALGTRGRNRGRRERERHAHRRELQRARSVRVRGASREVAASLDRTGSRERVRQTGRESDGRLCSRALAAKLWAASFLFRRSWSTASAVRRTCRAHNPLRGVRTHSHHHHSHASDGTNQCWRTWAHDGGRC